MKKISNYFKLALFAFVISASVVSCSNDEFFGFDDDFSKNTSHILTMRQINNHDYLDYNDNIPLDDERNIFIYSEAYDRLTIAWNNNHFSVKETSGAEASISERLYFDIKKSIDALNYSIGYVDREKHDKFKRQLRDNPEGIHYNNLNCPCYAITYFLYGNVNQKKLKEIDEKLYQKYGSRYVNGDLYLSEVPEAVHACNSSYNVSLQTSLTLGYSRALLCTESGVVNDTIIGHMSVITGIRDPNNNGNYYILGLVNPEVSTTINYINISKDLSIPLKNPAGNTTLFSSFIYK